MKRLFALIAAALALAGCASSGGDSGSAESASEVAIKGFAYSPDPLTVDAGTTVTFENGDAAPHTATADDGSFDTGNLGEGESKPVSFDSPGEFAYTCTVHPFMHGSVVVK